MATRNLTKKYVDLRNASKANRTLNVRSGNEDEYSDRDHLRQSETQQNQWKNFKSETLPPRWVEDIEKVDETVHRIETKIKELGSLHTKRLMVNFDTDEEEKEYEINCKTREITDQFRDAEAILKRFSKNDDMDPTKDNASELKVRNNIQRAVAKRLQSLSMSFRKSQKEYLGKLKAQKSEASGGGVFDFAEPERKASGMSAFVDDGFSQSQLQLSENMSTVVNQRDQEIMNIAKSIEELAAIFKELAVLVIDQGTILDRIDYNMETAVEHAKEGITQLHKAEEHQKNNIGMKCIIVLILLIVILMIVLIVKHQPSGNSSSGK